MDDGFVASAEKAAQRLQTLRDAEGAPDHFGTPPERDRPLPLILSTAGRGPIGLEPGHRATSDTSFIWRRSGGRVSTMIVTFTSRVGFSTPLRRPDMNFWKNLRTCLHRAHDGNIGENSRYAAGGSGNGSVLVRATRISTGEPLWRTISREVCV